MKGINYILSVLLSAIAVNASAVSISKFSATKEPTTQWLYSPTNVAINASGIKNRQYPITIHPQSQYIISVPIAVVNYETIGVDCSYHVATKSTHPLMVEIIGDNENVDYSYIYNGTPNVELAMGGYVEGITPQSTFARFKFSLSVAYDETEIAHIDEVQVYGTLKEWNKRVVPVISHEVTTDGIVVKWASVADAVTYKITYAEKSGGAEQSMSLDAISNQKEMKAILTGLKPETEYQYSVKAYNSAGVEISSSIYSFNNSAGVDKTQLDDTKVYVSAGELVIDTPQSCNCQIYSMAGVMIKNLSLVEGETRVSLPAGLYILNQPRNSRLIVIP
ncbi:MAG: fibronectin type III domain-containing protein [Muribaculaceae bacterium]|nr:fibronectin type III domain-containing protein [Muribaculaceae bacterium]